MQMIKISFRHFFNLCFLCSLITVSSNYGKANQIEEATIFVKNVGSEIIDIVEEEKSLDQKRQSFLILFNTHANINIISRAALGKPWRKLSDDLKLKFSDAFMIYLVNKYGQQFDEFSGAEMAVERTVDVGKRGTLVHTRFIMPGTSPISVKWQVWSKTDDLKLIDIIIEDISMLTMEREEIKNRLSIHNGIINSLIIDLRRN